MTINLKKINSIDKMRFKLYSVENIPKNIDPLKIEFVDDILSFINDELSIINKYPLVKSNVAPIICLSEITKSEIENPSNLLMCLLISQRNELHNQKPLMKTSFLFENDIDIHDLIIDSEQISLPNNHLSFGNENAYKNYRNIVDSVNHYASPNISTKHIVDIINQMFTEITEFNKCMITHNDKNEQFLHIMYSKEDITFEKFCDLFSKIILINETNVHNITEIVSFNYTLMKKTTYRLNDGLLSRMKKIFKQCMFGNNIGTDIIDLQDLSKKELIEKIMRNNY